MMGEDHEIEHTERVLHEVAAERERQRGNGWGNDHDDYQSHVQADVEKSGSKTSPRLDTWDELHFRRFEQVFAAAYPSERRDQLVKACAVYAAEIESIDRQKESDVQADS